MKTLNSIFTVPALILSLSLNAQFKVMSDGSPYAKGHIYFRAYEGDGLSGNVYIQARDMSGSSNLNMVFRTQKNGSIKNPMTLSSDGGVKIDCINPLTSNGYVSIVPKFCVGTAPFGEIYIDNSSGGNPTIWPWLSNVAYIGTSTNYFYKTYTNVIYRNTEYSLSDIKAKDNIKKIDGALKTLSKLRGVSYDYNNNAFINTPDSIKLILINKNKNRLGFVAQEVKEVLPQLVEHDDSTDLDYLNYEGIIPILVEAIKEQENILDAQSLKIKELESRLSKIENKINTDPKSGLKSSQVSDNITTNAVLYQNTPNPYTINTEIRYFLPENIQSASLYIFDMQGVMIKTTPLIGHGQGSVIINGTELKAGLYVYTLIVDSQEIDSKRMILTQ